MIEEVDTSGYVQHYFEKVYTELEHSPESFLRAALEFVERQDGLLSQPGSLESLTRLAQEITRRGANEDSPVSSPDTAPAPARGAPLADSAATAPFISTTPVPAASVEMADAEEPTPGRDIKDEISEDEEAESKGYRK
jgi:hypothetical protein